MKVPSLSAFTLAMLIFISAAVESLIVAGLCYIAAAIFITFANFVLSQADEPLPFYVCFIAGITVAMLRNDEELSNIYYTVRDLLLYSNAYTGEPRFKSWFHRIVYGVEDLTVYTYAGQYMYLASAAILFALAFVIAGHIALAIPFIPLYPAYIALALLDEDGKYRYIATIVLSLVIAASITILAIQAL